jgi:hypothetical protein
MQFFEPAVCVHSAAGVSKKSEKPYTAGHFGEGMKVQINRLLADGKCNGITYVTGTCKWDLKHMQAQHCTNETLHVLSTRLTAHHGHPSQDPTRLEETICTVHGYKTKPAVDRRCYLFLQPQPSMMPAPMSSAPPQVTSAGVACVISASTQPLPQVLAQQLVV